MVMTFYDDSRWTVWQLTGDASILIALEESKLTTDQIQLPFYAGLYHRYRRLAR